MNATEEILSLIPHRPPFLFVDAIESCEGETLVARRTWRAEEHFYAGHYPGAPITPGVLLCESVFQAGALLMAKLMRAGGAETAGVPLLTKVSDVRFRLPVYPGDTVQMEVRRTQTMGDFHFLSGVIRRGDKKVLNVDFSVAWKKPEPPATA